MKVGARSGAKGQTLGPGRMKRENREGSLGQGWKRHIL